MNGRFWAGLGTALLLQGCLLLANAGRTSGSLTARWSFGGQTCGQAGISDVQVTLNPRSTGSAVGPTQLGCQDDVFQLSPIREGEYTLVIEGFNSQNAPVFDATRTVLIVAGSNTDLGMVDLEPLLGALTVDWLFELPAGGGTVDCAQAGVVDVEVELTNSLGQVERDELIPCPNGPADLFNLEPDEYTVSMTGLGVYNTLSVPLYSVSGVGVSVARAPMAVLDPVPLLGINAGQFGSLEVHWSFGSAESCGSAAVSSIAVGIYRPGSTVAEDSFTAACTAPSALRTLFVPGNWRVTASGTGPAGTYAGETTINVAPGQVLALTVSLAPP